MRKSSQCENRPSASRRGYGHKWRLASKAFLALPENALCRICKARGKIVAARQVDHIVPHRGDQKLFWSHSNWQALCSDCGAEKSAREQAMYRTSKPVAMKGCDASGWPVDQGHVWNR